MINIFSHYVPGRLIFLAGLEALVLLLSAYVGIALHLGEPGVAVPAFSMAMPPQAYVFALSMLVVMTSMGLYQADVWRDTQSIGMRLAAAFMVGFVITGLVAFFVPSLRLAPYNVGVTLIVALAGSVLVRAAFYKWSDLGLFKSRVLVIGTGSRVMKLAECALDNPNHTVVGYLSMQPAKHYIPQPHVLTLAAGETIWSVVEKHGVDQIVLAVRDRRGGGFPVQELLECRLRGVKIVELPTFFEREYRQVLLESITPSWMVLGEGFNQSLLRNIMKRLLDLVVSGALLVLTLPIMLLAALCIYLEGGGQVLYRQERVGQGGRVFTLYKLRSMRADAEVDGTPHWAVANDDRITWVGKFMRNFRIDELPQIINVFKGDMSFVGPRPERPFFVDQLEKQIPYYALRHSVKPGITGWAQVRHPYGASVDDAIEKLQYDLYYVKNHCLFLDLTVLVATVEVVIWGKGAR